MVGTNVKIILTLVVLSMLEIKISISITAKRQIQSEDNDECRKGPHQEALVEKCCEVIQFTQVRDDNFDKCYIEISEDQRFSMINGPPQGGPGGSQFDGSGIPPPPPHGDHFPPPPPQFKPGEHPGNHAGSPFHFPCMEECLFNKTGRIGSDGKLDENALKTSIISKFTDEDMQTLARDASEKCLKEVAMMNFPNRICSSGAFEFNNCFNHEIFLNCPESKWTNTEECKNMKEHVLKCPRPGPLPA